jgi:hypothetical protein
MSLQPATPLCISPAAWTPVSISEEGTPSSTPSPVPSPSYSRASSPTLTPDGPSPRAGFHVDEREEGEVDEEEEEEESDYGESTAEFGSGRVIKDHRYGDPPIAKGKENERRSSVLLYSNAKHASIGQAPRTNIGRVSSSSNAHSSTDPYNLQPDDDTDDETDSEVEFDGDPGVGSQWLRGEVQTTLEKKKENRMEGKKNGPHQPEPSRISLPPPKLSYGSVSTATEAADKQRDAEIAIKHTNKLDPSSLMIIDNLPNGHPSRGPESLDYQAQLMYLEMLGRRRVELARQEQESLAQQKPLPVACNRCRKRMIMCDGSLPACNSCKVAGTNSCIYETHLACKECRQSMMNCGRASRLCEACDRRQAQNRRRDEEIDRTSPPQGVQQEQNFINRESMPEWETACNACRWYLTRCDQNLPRCAACKDRGVNEVCTYAVRSVLDAINFGPANNLMVPRNDPLAPQSTISYGYKWDSQPPRQTQESLISSKGRNPSLADGQGAGEPWISGKGTHHIQGYEERLRALENENKKRLLPGSKSAKGADDRDSSSPLGTFQRVQRAESGAEVNILGGEIRYVPPDRNQELLSQSDQRAFKDLNMQLRLLEQQNRKRLLFIKSAENLGGESASCSTRPTTTVQSQPITVAETTDSTSQDQSRDETAQNTSKSTSHAHQDYEMQIQLLNHHSKHQAMQNLNMGNDNNSSSSQEPCNNPQSRPNLMNHNLSWNENIQPASDTGNHAIQDHQMQQMLLEQQKQFRGMRGRHGPAKNELGDERVSKNKLPDSMPQHQPETEVFESTDSRLAGTWTQIEQQKDREEERATPELDWDANEESVPGTTVFRVNSISQMQPVIAVKKPQSASFNGPEEHVAGQCITPSGNRSLQEYQMQLMLLEQQNKKRNMHRLQEEEAIRLKKEGMISHGRSNSTAHDVPSVENISEEPLGGDSSSADPGTKALPTVQSPTEKPGDATSHTADKESTASPSLGQDAPTERSHGCSSFSPADENPAFPSNRPSLSTPATLPPPQGAMLQHGDTTSTHNFNFEPSQMIPIHHPSHQTSYVQHQEMLRKQQLHQLQIRAQRMHRQAAFLQERQKRAAAQQQFMVGGMNGVPMSYPYQHGRQSCMVPPPPFTPASRPTFQPGLQRSMCNQTSLEAQDEERDEEPSPMTFRRADGACHNSQFDVGRDTAAKPAGSVPLNFSTKAQQCTLSDRLVSGKDFPSSSEHHPDSIKCQNSPTYKNHGELQASYGPHPLQMSNFHPFQPNTYQRSRSSGNLTSLRSAFVQARMNEMSEGVHDGDPYDQTPLYEATPPRDCLPSRASLGSFTSPEELTTSSTNTRHSPAEDTPDRESSPTRELGSSSIVSEERSVPHTEPYVPICGRATPPPDASRPGLRPPESEVPKLPFAGPTISAFSNLYRIPSTERDSHDIPVSSSREVERAQRVSEKTSYVSNVRPQLPVAHFTFPLAPEPQVRPAESSHLTYLPRALISPLLNPEVTAEEETIEAESSAARLASRSARESDQPSLQHKVPQTSLDTSHQSAASSVLHDFNFDDFLSDDTIETQSSSVHSASRALRDSEQASIPHKQPQALLNSPSSGLSREPRSAATSRTHCNVKIGPFPLSWPFTASEIEKLVKNLGVTSQRSKSIQVGEGGRYEHFSLLSLEEARKIVDALDGHEVRNVFFHSYLKMLTKLMID